MSAWRIDRIPARTYRRGESPPCNSSARWWPVKGGEVDEAPEQGTLFADPSGPSDVLIGYRGPTACSAAGITYRQLDYWARTGLVAPTIRSAKGSGSQRLYSF